mmetsp:Transcript_43415/g.82834  ORF Transcript_43415/g.82834 Transcript_43415/m.82834 type:complete len:148 (-) Transcript_43415:347-790(-)
MEPLHLSFFPLIGSLFAGFSEVKLKSSNSTLMSHYDSLLPAHTTLPSSTVATQMHGTVLDSLCRDHSSAVQLLVAMFTCGTVALLLVNMNWKEYLSRWRTADDKSKLFLPGEGSGVKYGAIEQMDNTPSETSLRAEMRLKAANVDSL